MRGSLEFLGNVLVLGCHGRAQPHGQPASCHETRVISRQCNEMPHFFGELGRAIAPKLPSPQLEQEKPPSAFAMSVIGAGGGNRTRVISLEDTCAKSDKFQFINNLTT